MKEKQIERRFVQTSEIRAEEDGNKLVGYAAVFNSPAQIGNSWEVIRKGAFTKTIQESDIRALWNHDSNYVLGRVKADTLSLLEDDHGLKVEIILPNTQIANDLRESVRRGDISQMSFGFYVVKQNWTTMPDDNTQTLREILECQLFDVSPVTYPAYEDTEINLRNLAANCIDIDKAEGVVNSLIASIESENKNFRKEELLERLAVSMASTKTQSIEESEPEPKQEFHSVDILRKRLELKMKSF